MVNSLSVYSANDNEHVFLKKNSITCVFETKPQQAKIMLCNKHQQIICKKN